MGRTAAHEGRREGREAVTSRSEGLDGRGGGASRGERGYSRLPSVRFAAPTPRASGGRPPSLSASGPAALAIIPSLRYWAPSAASPGKLLPRDRRGDGEQGDREGDIVCRRVKPSGREDEEVGFIWWLKTGFGCGNASEKGQANRSDSGFLLSD